MSNFVCVRHEKCKVTNKVANAEREHNRDGAFAERDNIISDRTKYNLYYSNVKSGNMVEWFKKQRELYNATHKRKLRKDAVQCIDSVFCLSKCDINDIDKMMTAIKLTYNEILGGHNVPIKIWVHCDELGECHGHGMITPIDTDGNCVTDLLMKKTALQNIQDIFNKNCNLLGLNTERGISKQERFEKNMAQNYHVDNWKFLKSNEGQKWINDKTQNINELEKKELELLERNKELEEKIKEFGSAQDNKSYSLDDIINMGRF